MTKIAIPSSPAELEEFLGDTAKLNAAMADGQLGEVVRAYAKTLSTKDPEIAAQIKAEVDATFAEFLRDNQAENIGRVNLAPGTQPPWNAGSFKQGAGYNSRAVGAQVDVLFDGPADYLRTIWHKARHTSERDARLAKLTDALKNYSSSVPSEGGFLVPEALRSQLLQVSMETAIVRPRAMVVPMETLRVSFPAIDETSRSSSVFGGIVCYWTAEGSDFTESEATFGEVTLEARNLTAYCEVPNTLIADSAMSFEAFINRKLPQALSFYEDDAFANGNGVGQPLGYLKGSGLLSVTKQTGQAADTIVWENIVKMFSRMLPGSLGRAVWVASINTFPELATMALSVGTGGSAIWLNNGVEGPPMTILGRPVIFTEKAPKLGDAGDISFVDFDHYLVGDRQVMTAESSSHYKFQANKTAYKIISRIDGRPWLGSAITPKNGGDTLSAYVQIAERA